MKRLFAFILVFVLTVSMSVTTFAEDAADVWDGSVAAAFAGGDGTEENPYQIATGAQFAYLSQLCQDSDSEAVTEKYYVLTSDIDLAGRNWTPIGSLYTCYASGWFDGGGHTISGLYIETYGTVASYSSYGLFGVFEGEIKDLTVSGKMIFNNFQDGSSGFLAASYVGGLCGLAATNVYNCRSEVDITVNTVMNATNCGGLVGDLEQGLMQNCIYTGTINSTNNDAWPQSQNGNKNIGGIAGSLSYGGIINSCKNEGDITAVYGYVGGIAGWVYTSSGYGGTVIANSVNSGNVVLSITGRTGGIAGFASTSGTNNLYIINCLDRGNVTYSRSEQFPPAASDTPIYVGTVYGYAHSYTQASVIVNNCYYINDASSGNIAVTEDEEVKKIAEEEAKTAEFMNLIADNSNYENSSAYWSQAYDKTVVLTFELADYTELEAAIAQIPEDLTLYTNESVQALNDAVENINYGLLYADQATVDGYAAAVSDAVAALKYKDADYTAVDAAIANIPTDLSGYTDESVQALNDAVNAVVCGKNITQQSEVDAMAQAIQDAVNSLEKKPASSDVTETTADSENDNNKVSKNKSKTSPNTGNDASSGFLMTLPFAFAVIMLILISKKRRKEDI